MRFSSSRPASSPGRTENPPLLMRFLRTNIGSRSRGRSRSRPRSRKPIFFRRKNTETQEPSSPKVTCMGQVRIKRSKKPKPGTNRGATKRPRFGWVKKAFLCHPFTGKIKPTCWRKWKSFSHVSFSRKSEKRSSSSRSEPIFGRSTVEPEESEEVQREEHSQEEETHSAAPPRNALFLTRCRSAPYRSPSFADSFFAEEESNKTEEAPSHDSGKESVESEEVKRSVLVSPRRQCLVLTRCNSEPSRVGGKLVPEISYRRLGFT